MSPSLSRLPDWGVSATSVAPFWISSTWSREQPTPSADGEVFLPDTPAWEDKALDSTPNDESFIYSSPSTWGKVEPRATPDPEPSPVQAALDEIAQHHQTTNAHQTFQTIKATTLHTTTKTASAEERNNAEKRNNAKKPKKSSTTTEESEATKTSDPEDTLATQVTVGAPKGAPSGAPPEVCHKSTYRYETKISIRRTGIVRIRAGGNGWGPPGSIWNFTTSAGSKLIDMKAPCQGSGCTGINGNGNQEYGGDVKQRSDGSWFMNVTENMQHALMISGTLVTVEASSGNDGSSRHRSRDQAQKKKHTVHIEANPPCGTIAQSCVKQNMEPSMDQWDAYATDKFLDKYLDEHPKIKSMDDFRKQVMDDFYSPTNRPGQNCDVTGKEKCETPDIEANCKWRAENPKALKKWSNDDEARGMMMAFSITRYTQFYQRMWQTWDTVGDKVKDKVTMTVQSITVEGEKAQTEHERSIGSKTTLAGVALGFLTALMVPLDAFTPTRGTSLLVGGSISLSSAVGTAGNVQSEKESQETTAAEKLLYRAASERDGMEDLTDALKTQVEKFYTSTKWGKKAIYDTFKGGAWVTDQTERFFNKQGQGAKVSDWFTKYLISNYITKALTDQNAYVLFIRYGDNIPYGKEKFGLSKTECEDRFRNNPEWKYAVSCDMDLPGEDGVQGMSILTRPNVQGSESSSWVTPKVAIKGRHIYPADIMSSAIWGHYQHSFNFTLLNQDWSKLLSQGTSNVSSVFNDGSVRQPGLFPIPVCEITDLAYMPDIGQVRKDWKNSHEAAKTSQLYGSYDPCSCAHYEYTAPDGRSGKFIDFVSDKVKDSIQDCEMFGKHQTPPVGRRDFESLY